MRIIRVQDGPILLLFFGPSNNRFCPVAPGDLQQNMASPMQSRDETFRLTPYELGTGCSYTINKSRRSLTERWRINEGRRPSQSKARSFACRPFAGQNPAVTS